MRRSITLALAPFAFSISTIAASAEEAPTSSVATAALPPLSAGWRFVEQDGASLYRAICQGCHMPDGMGATGAGMYPALANNPRLASGGYVAYNVVQGRRGMPGFGQFLNDAQVAAVANYVRSNMGNRYADVVTTTEVAKLR
jgi:mono/diheme cytochrome c family protein